MEDEKTIQERLEDAGASEELAELLTVPGAYTLRAPSQLEHFVGLVVAGVSPRAAAYTVREGVEA